MKVILSSTEDLIGQAFAAKFALTVERPTDNYTLVERGSTYYGIKWNKNSITVYPQRK